jgi:serine/threonine protein kinase
MEYCSGLSRYCSLRSLSHFAGGDLRHFLDAVGSLEEEECALFFAEMIMAVHDLHKMGYLHRDIKPENFLIDPKYVCFRLIYFLICWSHSLGDISN